MTTHAFIPQEIHTALCASCNEHRQDISHNPSKRIGDFTSFKDGTYSYRITDARHREAYRRPLALCVSRLESIGADVSGRLDVAVLNFGSDDRERLYAWSVESLHSGMSAIIAGDRRKALRCYVQAVQYRAAFEQEAKHTTGGQWWDGALCDALLTLRCDIEDLIDFTTAEVK